MEGTSGTALAVDWSNNRGPRQSGSESLGGQFGGRRVRQPTSSNTGEVSPRASQLEQRDTGVTEGRITLRQRLASMVRSTLRFLNPIAALRPTVARKAPSEATDPAHARHWPCESPMLRGVPGFQQPASPRLQAANNGMPGPDESSLLSAVSWRSHLNSEDSARFASPPPRAGTITVETVPCKGPSGLPCNPDLVRRADVRAERVLQLLEFAQTRPLDLDEAGEFHRLTELDSLCIPARLVRELRDAAASAKSFDSKLERAALLLESAATGGLTHQKRLELIELQRTMKAELGTLLLRCNDWQEPSAQSDPPSPAGELLSSFFRMRCLDRGLMLVEHVIPQIRQFASAAPATPGAPLDLAQPDGPYAVPADPGISRPPLRGQGHTDPAAAPSISATSPAMAQANGIELAYSDTGGNAPAIVLIRGLGTQMTEWSPALIEGLRQQGLRVITFDNRDTGLSSKLEGNYPLSAMADDVADLLDFLSVDRAHIFGISLGGMVAQLLAHQHPQRVLSLCSVMSSSGNPDLPSMADDVKEALFRQVEGREATVRLDAENREFFGSPRYPENERTRLAAARAAYDRCYCPQGVGRQLGAAMSDGSRVERLKTIDAPTLVIHGAADRLLLPACGEDTARWISGAELAIVDGMGHNIPDALAPHIVELVGGFIGRRAAASGNR